MEEGVGSHIIIKGLRQARDLVSITDFLDRWGLIWQAVKKIDEIAVTIDKSDPT